MSTYRFPCFHSCSVPLSLITTSRRFFQKPKSDVTALLKEPWGLLTLLANKQIHTYINKLPLTCKIRCDLAHVYLLHFLSLYSPSSYLTPSPSHTAYLILQKSTPSSILPQGLCTCSSGSSGFCESPFPNFKLHVKHHLLSNLSI